MNLRISSIPHLHRPGNEKAVLVQAAMGGEAGRSPAGWRGQWPLIGKIRLLLEVFSTANRKLEHLSPPAPSSKAPEIFGPALLRPPGVTILFKKESGRHFRLCHWRRRPQRRSA